MAKRLYVGNLPYSVGDAQLSDIFAAVGTVVQATVIMDKFSGRSKGFGFVEMSTDEEAQKAIDTFNDKEVEGRKLVVNEAKEREERRDFKPRQSFGGGNDRRGGFGGGRRDDRRGGGNRY